MDVPIIDDDDVEADIENFLGNIQLAAGFSSDFGEITVPQATVNIEENDGMKQYRRISLEC